jgi:N-acetylneuraminic acid mutarotase
MGYVGIAVIDDTIYVAGGYDGENEYDQMYAFTPNTGEWQKKKPMQEKRGGLGLVTGNNNLFAIGGGWDQPLDTNEKYDPQTNTWTNFETSFANQGRNLGVATIDTNIYVVGGWDGTDKQFMDSIVSYQFLFQYFLPIPSF